MERYQLNKNGEGYADNTAYKAIRNVNIDIKSMVTEFVNRP